MFSTMLPAALLVFVATGDPVDGKLSSRIRTQGHSDRNVHPICVSGTQHCHRIFAATFGFSTISENGQQLLAGDFAVHYSDRRGRGSAAVYFEADPVSSQGETVFQRRPCGSGDDLFVCNMWIFGTGDLHGTSYGRDTAGHHN